MSAARAWLAAGDGEASVQADVAASVQDSLQPGVAASASEAAVSPMPPRVGPPDTTYYMKVGYVVAFVVFALYIGLLLRRVADIRRSS